MISSRQTSAHDHNIDAAIKCLRAVKGTQLNSTQLTAQLSCYSSGPKSTDTTPEEHNTHTEWIQHVERHALLRVYTQKSPSTIEQISQPLLRSSATTHTRWNISSTSLNSPIIILTAKINTYSLAFTFPLYRDVSINSSDVGHFKLAHPLTLQIFIRLFTYAWRQTGYGDLKPDPRWNISQAWRAQLTWLEAHWSAYGSYICIGSVT